MIQTDGLLSLLRTAEMWLYYDTTPEGSDQRNRFRAAIRKIENSLLDGSVHLAVREARIVLAGADSVWLKARKLEEVNR